MHVKVTKEQGFGPADRGPGSDCGTARYGMVWKLNSDFGPQTDNRTSLKRKGMVGERRQPPLGERQLYEAT